MTIPTVCRLYRPQGPERVAVVSAQPSYGQPGCFLIQVGRGAGGGKTSQGASYGPYAEDELPQHFAAVVEGLKQEGFQLSGQVDALLALSSPQSRTRARAALRLGWRRTPEAVDPILDACGKAVDDICSLVDALGAIGDPQALPLLRQQAARKLLSRRRSAVEALRRLGDQDGLAEVRSRALERLPPAIRSVLEKIDASADLPHPQLVQALQALDASQQGLALDTLYEVGSPAAAAAVRAVCGQIQFGQAHVWRYVKSIIKRSMLRQDFLTWAELSHTLEVQGRTASGLRAVVKSGYDGAQRETSIFSRKTQNYMRRLAWRYLRTLARYRPEIYSTAAAEALIPYTADDAQEPNRLYGAWSRCYVLHQILWGDSARFTLDYRSLLTRFRDAESVTAPPSVREEPFAELWDAQPRAFLQLLARSQLVEVHTFAVRAIAQKHPQLIQQATATEITAMLGAPYELTVNLALQELDRRFDPQQPDWPLLDSLSVSANVAARAIARRWVGLTASLWAQSPGRILALLQSPDADLRAQVLELSEGPLQVNDALRSALAPRLLEILRAPEPTPGAHQVYAQLARASLLNELEDLVGMGELLGWLNRGSPSCQAIAGDLLARRPDAVTTLGLEGIGMLAQHAMASVRGAAHALIRQMIPSLRADPSLLFILADSEWEDTRAAALELLGEVLEPAALDADRLMGLLDSNLIEVQKRGRELALRHADKIAPQELAGRLVQHPHPHMRRFALELVEQHLPAGAAPLAELERFFRTILFDTWPEQLLKRRVLDFLAARGAGDAGQARVAAGILQDVVRVQGRRDFERALAALVRLQLAFPEIETAVVLPAGDVA